MNFYVVLGFQQVSVIVFINRIVGGVLSQGLSADPKILLLKL